MSRRTKNLLLRAACAGVLLLAGGTVASANLLTNPGFEDGGGSYAGWFTFGGHVELSLPTGDNIIRTGAAASKIYGNFAGCPGAPQFSVAGYGQTFTPTPGQVYEFSGYSFVSSGDPLLGTLTCANNRCVAKIVFFNAPVGGAELCSNEIVIGDGNTVTDQWNAFSVSAPAPAGAQRIEALILYLQPGCDPGAVYVDDLSLVATTPTTAPNVLANSSFTSGLTGWTTFGNVYTEARAFGVRTPTGSAKLFSTFTPGSDSGMFQSFAAVEGEYWQFDIHSMTTCQENPIAGTNDNTATAVIVFRDAADVQLSATETVIINNVSPLGTWTKHTVAAAAPAGTAKAQAYVLFISPSSAGGAMWVDDAGFRMLGTVDVSGPPRANAFELSQNVPNPFGPATRIDFALARPGTVALRVYDVAGRRVATLVEGRLDAGPHSVSWDGRTAAGFAASPGVYRCVLETAEGRTARSMLLLR
jgi:hypothetical protein